MNAQGTPMHYQGITNVHPLFFHWLIKTRFDEQISRFQKLLESRILMYG